MSEPTIARPTSDDQNQWQAYWTVQDEPWHTEPEIAPDRQRELAERRDTIQPDIEKGIYPFKDVRLSRADVEWLLHEHHPIDWSDGYGQMMIRYLSTVILSPTQHYMSFHTHMRLTRRPANEPLQRPPSTKAQQHQTSNDRHCAR
jgi:hypothetical protein